MGRHTVVNPKTGRRVYKTGAIGRQIAKGKGKSASKKPTTTKKAATQAKPRCKSIKKCYACPGSTKCPSPLLKTTKSGSTRPSARAMYDLGDCSPVFYTTALQGPRR